MLILPFFISIGKPCREGHLNDALVNHSPDYDLSLGTNCAREPRSLLSCPHSPGLALIFPGEQTAQLLSTILFFYRESFTIKGFFYLKSVPVSSLLPELVKTNPALGTFSMVNVVPVRPDTGLPSTNLVRVSCHYVTE